MKCNGEVESSGGGKDARGSKEAKGEVKGWRKCNHRYGIIRSRRGFCCCCCFYFIIIIIFFFFRVVRRKV